MIAFFVPFQKCYFASTYDNHYITAQAVFHHCTSEGITAHFMHHCTLKQALTTATTTISVFLLIIITIIIIIIIIIIVIIIIFITRDAKIQTDRQKETKAHRHRQTVLCRVLQRNKGPTESTSGLIRRLKDTDEEQSETVNRCRLASERRRHADYCMSSRDNDRRRSGSEGDGHDIIL